MADTPHMEFRRLREDELVLAHQIYQSLVDTGEFGGEAFGLRLGEAGLRRDEVWGLFIRGDVAGAAWLRNGGGRTAEVTAIALPRARWRLGLTAWMLEQLAASAKIAGSGEVLVRLAEGSPAMGEALIDSGFSGPDPENEDFPVGEWRVRVGLPALETN